MKQNLSRPVELNPREFEVLDRLAPPTQAAGRLVIRFDTTGRTLLSDLLDVALSALEQGDPVEPPTLDDVAVLIQSENPRVRAIGVRLASHAK